MKKLLTALLITASATAMASDAEIKSKLQALGAKNIEVKDSPVKGLKTAVTVQGIFICERKWSICFARQNV